MKNKITIAPRYYRWHVDKGVVWIEKNTSYAHLNWKIPLAQTALVLVDIWSHHYLKDTSSIRGNRTQQNCPPPIRLSKSGNAHCSRPGASSG